jgi:hypothetical protein
VSLYFWSDRKRCRAACEGREKMELSTSYEQTMRTEAFMVCSDLRDGVRCWLTKN